MSQTPSLGRIVHYSLSAGDVAEIDRMSPQRDADGRYLRNPAREGDVYPAQVTSVFGTGGTVNLVVQLDGPAQYWATSRQPGELVDGCIPPGSWCWPPRV